MSQAEMLAAARSEYHHDDIQPEILRILEPENEFLQDIVDQFGRTRRNANNTPSVCFYELKSSNVGKIVGGKDRTVCLLGSCMSFQANQYCRDV
jgi:hypothetical protein